MEETQATKSSMEIGTIQGRSKTVGHDIYYIWGGERKLAGEKGVESNLPSGKRFINTAAGSQAAQHVRCC